MGFVSRNWLVGFGAGAQLGKCPRIQSNSESLDSFDSNCDNELKIV